MSEHTANLYKLHKKYRKLTPPIFYCSESYDEYDYLLNYFVSIDY